VSVTQQASLLVEDMKNGPSWSSLSLNELLQNYEIFIGDNIDYKLNQKCKGGPFMKTDDQNSYSYDGYAAGQKGQSGKVWNFGLEKFCNL